MIELFEQEIRQNDRQSSKGNQLKWEKEGVWYKADFTGYEGLAEYVISNLLIKSSLQEEEFVIYEPEEIKYKSNIFLGAKSESFLKDDWQIITIERLYKNAKGRSLYEMIWHIEEVKDRLEYLVDEIRRITGLNDFGIYMNKVLTIDAFFMNEDRHLHNLAVLMNRNGQYDYCPIFDNGAGLLSDTRIDYPLDGDIYDYINEVQAKTISVDFDEQLEASEDLYGNNLTFTFSKKDIEDIVDGAIGYSTELKIRVKKILFDRYRKYSYLVKN